MAFGPETSEFTLLTIAPFAVIRQKSAYYSKYLGIYWSYSDLLYRFGRRVSGHDFPNIRLAVAQGALLWQPVNMGDVRKRRVAFDNGLDYRKSAFKRFNGVGVSKRIGTSIF